MGALDEWLTSFSRIFDVREDAAGRLLSGEHSEEPLAAPLSLPRPPFLTCAGAAAVFGGFATTCAAA